MRLARGWSSPTDNPRTPTDPGSASGIRERCLFVRTRADIPACSISPSAFADRCTEALSIALVDASAGSISADQPKTVALALLTDELDGKGNRRGTPRRGHGLCRRRSRQLPRRVRPVLRHRGQRGAPSLSGRERVIRRSVVTPTKVSNVSALAPPWRRVGAGYGVTRFRPHGSITPYLATFYCQLDVSPDSKPSAKILKPVTWSSTASS